MIEELGSVCHVRAVVVGAEELKRHIADSFEARFGIRPLEGYGATELSPVVSLNIPDVDIVVKTDYVGIVSGREEDKSDHFEVFFGESKSAPMIKECPVNAECKVYDIIELPGTMLVVGEIVHAYSAEIYTTDRVLDYKKIHPFVFTAPEHYYRELGEKIGTAFVDGKSLSKNE